MLSFIQLQEAIHHFIGKKPQRIALLHLDGFGEKETSAPG